VPPKSIHFVSKERARKLAVDKGEEMYSKVTLVTGMVDDFCRMLKFYIVYFSSKKIQIVIAPI
jgi:hypothetical protein